MRSLRDSLPLKDSNESEGCTLAILERFYCIEDSIKIA
jgi:hypothetical protein